MSFRVVDNETGEVLFDTMRIDHLVEYLEKMQEVGVVMKLFLLQLII